MSDFVIRDGTGQGNRAKVNNLNELIVGATVQTEAAQAAELGQYYKILVAEVSASTSEYDVLHIINNSTKIFTLSSIVFSWNGGSTNHNRTAIGRIYSNGTVPTANYNTLTPINFNLQSPLAAPLLCYGWNGVGSGMTQANTGSLMSSIYYGVGRTEALNDDLIVLGYGNSACVSVKAEEAGLMSVSLAGFFKSDV
jgi:hypothetical protein